MFDKIGPEDILVQVESSVENNSIPEGIAVSQGTYDLSMSSSTNQVTAKGVNKSGNQSCNGVYADVTGWTTRSGYPDPSLTSNKMVVDKLGTVVVAVSAAFTNENVSIYNGWLSLSFTTYYSRGNVRILVNGNVVAAASGRQTATINKVVNVVPGDQIWVQASSTQARSNSAYPTLLASGTSWIMNPYDNSAIDFEEDMAYGPDRGFFDDTWGRYVSSTYLKAGLPMAISGALYIDGGDGRTTTGRLSLVRGNASGPILAQNRHPIPVVPGTRVKFTGAFRIRQTGARDEQTEAGVLTGLDVRMSIWGVGVSKDEYGVESLRSQELYWYQGTLQPSNSVSRNLVEHVPPTDMNPGVVPEEGVSYIFWTCSIVQTVENRYAAANFSEAKSTGDVRNGGQQLVPSPTSTADMTYFGWKHDNPLKISIEPPPGTRRTTTHTYSRTGVAYKNENAEFFTNVKTGAKITFFGSPNTSCAINVYNYNGGVQGSSLGSFSASAGEIKTVTINPTGGGGIRIAKSGANDVYVESVVNPTGNTLSTLKTRQKIVNFIDVNSDITKISVLREEGDTGSITVDFDSEDLDPLVSNVLGVGKVIRFLGRHYGEGDIARPSDWVGEANYTTIYTGVITQSKTEYDYEDNPIIQIVAYDANDHLEKTKSGIAFDTFEKYIPFLNRSGQSVIMPNGFDVGGAYGFMDDQFKFVYRPSAHGDITLAKGLEMTRNTNKAYVYVNKDNEIILTNTLDPTPKLVFTDGTDDGDISYGKMVKKSDTKAIVNKLELRENSLDPDDYKNRAFTKTEDGPPADFKYVATRRRSAMFSNENSSALYGEFSKTFDVIRGDGDLKKLYRGNIGDSFTDWADSFLSENLEPKLQIHEFTVPIKSSDDIRMISSLELLDMVTVIYKGEAYNIRIKEIEHTVTPGKWFVVLKFSPTNQMTMW